MSQGRLHRKPRNALVAQADGRRGQSCARGPPWLPIALNKPFRDLAKRYQGLFVELLCSLAKPAQIYFRHRVSCCLSLEWREKWRIYEATNPTNQRDCLYSHRG